MKSFSKYALTLALTSTLAFASVAHANTSKATDEFIKKATIGDRFEIETSQIALVKSTNADVRKFAQQMIDDHTKNSQNFKANLTSAKADPSAIPAGLDDKHKQKIAELKASGDNFDKQYIAAQTEAHTEAVSLYRDYSKNGDNATLKTFATDTLPTLEHHKEMVSELKAS